MNKQLKQKQNKEKVPFDKKLSVLMLFGADNADKLLAIFLSMTVCEVLAFCIVGIQSETSFIEVAVYNARIPIYAIMTVSYVLLCIVLSNTLISKGGKPIYTIQRLMVDEKEFFRLSCIYNALASICYLGFQALSILIMVLIFGKTGSGFAGPQSIMMSLYRIPFFHSVIPMENLYLVARNIIYVCCLGILSALQSQRQREGMFSYTFYLSAVIIALTFVYGPMASNDLILRVRDVVAMIIVLPCTYLGSVAGYDHRAEKQASDSFEASVAEYRNENEA